MGADQQPRVLVVDDEEEIRRLMVTALRPSPLTVDVAADGATAISLIEEHPYSVVLLDLLLPGIDGFGVIEALQRTARPQPPVVIVISGAEHHITEQLDSRAIHGVIRKPFDPLEVASVVAACAEIRGRSAFETMAIATMISSAPFFALLKL